MSGRPQESSRSREAPTRIEPSQAALLIVDVQARLSAAMNPDTLAACERNLLVLIELARRLSIPTVLSEQYRKGLGETLPALTQALGLAHEAALNHPVHRLEKITFACTDNDDFVALAQRLGRRQWIVAGMETHICVWQTVRGLRAWGNEIHVPADAVMSRDPANHRVGLDLMDRAGAWISSTETIAFDALGRAGNEDFKAISRMVK